MLLFVINNSSTSFCLSIIDTEKNYVFASGGTENIGILSSYYKYENNRGNRKKVKIDIKNYIFDYKLDVLNSINDIDAIGHRVVHGGEKYVEATFLDKGVLSDIEQLSVFVPLDNIKALETIKNCQYKFRGIDNIAVFDIVFNYS